MNTCKRSKRIRPPALHLVLIVAALGACAQPAPPQETPPDTPPVTAPPTTPPAVTPPVTPPPTDTPEPQQPGWTPLLETTLEGWSPWLTQSKGDPKGIFKVEDGVLRILDI